MQKYNRFWDNQAALLSRAGVVICLLVALLLAPQSTYNSAVARETDKELLISNVISLVQSSDWRSIGEYFARSAPTHTDSWMNLAKSIEKIREESRGFREFFRIGEKNLGGKIFFHYFLIETGNDFSFLEIVVQKKHNDFTIRRFTIQQSLDKVVPRFHYLD